MVNTRMFVFKHPKYYKELRERNKSDQAISLKTHDGECERAPDPGLKLQAASSLILEPWNKKTEEVFLGKGPRAFTMIKVLSGCFTWNAI